LTSITATQKCKILLVEDEAIPAMMIEMGLMASGFDMCPTVASGEDAILAASQQRPNLILMDIHLAGVINGIEAAEKIIAEYNVPIIFLSGYTDPEMAERAFRLRPLAYRTKPVSWREIEKIILDWQRANDSPAVMI